MQSFSLAVPPLVGQHITTVPLQENITETEDLARRSTREFEAHATSGDAPMQSFTSAVPPVIGLHSTSASPDKTLPGELETASLLMNSCRTTISLQNNVAPTDVTVAAEICQTLPSLNAELPVAFREDREALATSRDAPRQLCASLASSLGRTAGFPLQRRLLEWSRHLLSYPRVQAD
jgi:hypothetical protein